MASLFPVTIEELTLASVILLETSVLVSFAASMEDTFKSTASQKRLVNNSQYVGQS